MIESQKHVNITREIKPIYLQVQSCICLLKQGSLEFPSTVVTFRRHTCLVGISFQSEFGGCPGMALVREY